MTASLPSHSDAYPDLEPGLNVLQGEDRRTPALHRIVVSELQERDGKTYWLDARNNASTYHLAEVADNHRILDHLWIARAFTAYQHHAIARTLAGTVDWRTSLLVAPAVADLYRDDDVPSPKDARYCTASIRILGEIGSVFDIPVLVSTGVEDSLTDVVVEQAEQVIEYESTEFGYRYTAEGFETTVYWQEEYWQTTIPYWVELFGSVEEYAMGSAYDVGLVDATI